MNAAGSLRRRPQPGTVVVAIQITVTAAGLGLVALGPWRFGLGMIGAVMVGASVARTLLPERLAGLLRVRRPTADVFVMTTLGIVLLVLAFVVPDQRPGPGP